MKKPIIFFLLLLIFSAYSAAEGQTSSPSSEIIQSISGNAGEAKTFFPAPRLKSEDYPRIKGVNSRTTVWLAAQTHLWFAAFVLAVPIFVFVIELLGVLRRDARYDRIAYEFIRISVVAYSITAVTGGLLLFGLLVFYPDLMKYLASIFGGTMLLYALLFFVESACLYTYYYGWKAMSNGSLKWAHLLVGFILNATGTALMFVANSWATFMMSPQGVTSSGVFSGNLWQAVNNPLWGPMNLHRFIANVAYGGSIVAAYAAYKFLSAVTEEEKAHYDWMGYTSNLIAIGALLPLPFAGYWLTAEVYRFSQQMGITLMGGAFAWLFIIQAVLIGALFLSANYYLWCGLGRSSGGARYTPYVKYIAFVLFLSFLVWFTPHTMILKPVELKSIGSQYHPYLGPLGLMPAKNVAVNIMVVFTYLSFLIYRRANKVCVVEWAWAGNLVQIALFTAAIINIVYLGVYYGYFTNAAYKVASSVPQVATTAFCIAASLVIEFFIHRGAKAEPVSWGRVPERSQYSLILLAVTFTWLMGLMGYIRSAIRQHWHIYSIMRDNSPDAFTPSIDYAVKVVSVGTIIFMAIVIFIFWLSQLTGEGE